jgi:hypothetical protein
VNTGETERKGMGIQRKQRGGNEYSGGTERRVRIEGKERGEWEYRGNRVYWKTGKQRGGDGNTGGTEGRE